MPFVRAGPAEILRASQKDEAVIRHLNKRLERVLIYLADFPIAVKYKSALQLLSHFVFYYHTTLRGLQTLGEEYTGIIQVDGSLRRIPPKHTLLLVVLLEAVGSTYAPKLQKVIEKKLVDKKILPNKAGRADLNFLCFLIRTIPLLTHFHKALFFLNSGTYHLSRRIAGVHYAIVRFWLKDRASLKGFRFLGLVSMLQLLTMFYQRTFEALQQVEITNNDCQTHDMDSRNNMSSKQCIICVEQISSPTATPCGHIFCWKCIAEWSQNEEMCPICRENVLSSRLVPLTNYS